MVRSVGWSSPSDFAVYLAVMVNGLGRADEAATGLAGPPAGVAACALHPAPRSTIPARTAAAGKRLFMRSTVPPIAEGRYGRYAALAPCRIGAALRAGLWPARK